MAPIEHKLPPITAAILAIVPNEIFNFTGKFPLPPGEKGKENSALSDLVSDCLLALVDARKNFNPALGFKFKTYAVKCVRNVIRRKPCKKKDVTGGKYKNKPLRLDVPVGDGRLTLAEAIHDRDHDNEILSDAVWARLQELMPAKEFNVLRWRMSGLTNASIGELLSVTEGRVRQITKDALESVEAAYDDKKLQRATYAPGVYAEEMKAAEAVLNCDRSNMAGFWDRRDRARFYEEWEARAFFGDWRWRRCLPDEFRFYDAISIATLAAKELGMSLDSAEAADDSTEWIATLNSLSDYFSARAATPRGQPATTTGSPARRGAPIYG